MTQFSVDVMKKFVLFLMNSILENLRLLFAVFRDWITYAMSILGKEAWITHESHYGDSYWTKKLASTEAVSKYIHYV